MLLLCVSYVKRLRDSIALGLCLDMLERRLLEVLRFELGSVYTVNVSLSFVISNPTQHPKDLGKGECFISTACPPDKVGTKHRTWDSTDYLDDPTHWT